MMSFIMIALELTETPSTFLSTQYEGLKLQLITYTDTGTCWLMMPQTMRNTKKALEVIRNR